MERSKNKSIEKKQVLVVYYSQTGQLKRIIKSMLGDLEKNNAIQLSYQPLQPKKPYPFPWSRYEFCDVLPESRKGIPCDLEPLTCDLNIKYDLVILAYTIWFLSPSIPINSFFHTKNAKTILNKTPVITVIGCRNMWVLSQERIKKAISELEGKLLGNIVFTDKNPNLIGIITIARWMLTGKKEKFLGMFPKPGISDKDIHEASRFGAPIINSLLKNNILSLNQDELNKKGAVTINKTLQTMEKRVSKIFNIWAHFILKKGNAGNKKRKRRVLGFYCYLNFVIVFIVPIISIIAPLIRMVRSATRRNIPYAKTESSLSK